MKQQIEKILGFHLSYFIYGLGGLALCACFTFSLGFLMEKELLGENYVSACFGALFLSALLSAFWKGKHSHTRRFLKGLFAGCMLFILLLVLGLSTRGVDFSRMPIVATFVLLGSCCGAMLSVYTKQPKQYKNKT